MKLIEDIYGEVWGVRQFKGGGEVGIKVRTKVIRFPISDDEKFELGETVRLVLHRD